jgi:hypothetical protein
MTNGFYLFIFQLPSAAFKGHLEILKFLHGAGCPAKDWICNDAAQGGHVNVLEWLRGKGFSFHADTCAYAAEGGHKHVIQWLRSKGCPWNSNCYTAAVISGSRDLMDWLASEGCPGARQHGAAQDTCECCGEPISDDNSDSDSDGSDGDGDHHEVQQGPLVQIVVHTNNGFMQANSGAMLAHFLEEIIGPGFPFAPRPQGEEE